MQNFPGNKVFSKKSAASEVLKLVLAILSSSKDEFALPKQDAGGLGPLIQNLLFTISRHRASFDFLLDKYSEGKIRPRLRRVLWWALAEMFYLDGLPAAVVVDTATGFVKVQYSRSEAGFVNALLRRLAAIAEGQNVPAEFLEAPQHVHLELSADLFQHWRKIWPFETIKAWAELWQRPADILLRRCKTAFREVPRVLERLPVFPWAPEAAFYHFAGGEAVNLSELLSTPGEFYVQDPSTLLAPALLAVKPGEQVGDLCCAPGGKSLLLAEALQQQGKLFCRDRSESRLQRVRENLAAYQNVEIAVGDAQKPDLPAQSLQALLLDVPCSNTGVIRRRPDVRWTYNAQKLKELLVLQSGILDNTAGLLCNGGRLVYSTCSIEPEENFVQIARFLNQHPEFKLIREEQLFPDIWHDGAYAALLVRGDNV